MNNQSKLSLLSLAVLASSLVAFSSHAGESGPCKQIKSACEAGGYVKGNHKKNGKGLFVDCMKKIMAGESVEGVSIPADEVAACKAKKEKHAAAKAAKAAS
ncbi:MAG: hypothetical protein JST04_04245 [Bdellovibrionales bacterium]|nr:hypothetical protein [Bdellovibrionales bacterium]